MKKIIYIIAMLGFTFFCGINVFAGDVPGDLLSEDKALLFFGEVVSYDVTDKHITILPTKKIRGDVNTEVSQKYEYILLVGEDKFTPVEGEMYLMAYFDENNPLYVFSTEGDDTKTLEIKGIAGINMWERMQKYLNEGAFEQKEAERLERIKEATPAQDLAPPSETGLMPSQTPTPASTYTNVLQRIIANWWWYGLIGVVIVAGLIWKKRCQRR